MATTGSPTAQFLRGWKIFKFSNIYYASLRGTIDSSNTGWAGLPGSFGEHHRCQQSLQGDLDKWTAGGKQQLLAAWVRHPVEDPGSGLQEPEPCPKLFSEQLWSMQNVKGWFEKTIYTQVGLPSLPAEDLCQQPITCLLSSWNFYNLFLIFIQGLKKRCAHTHLWKICSKDTQEAMIWLQAQKKAFT